MTGVLRMIRGVLISISDFFSDRDHTDEIMVMVSGHEIYAMRLWEHARALQIA